MKTKKIFAAALAGLCAVSAMGISAFAEDKKVETAGETSYKISAGFQAPAINVTVPSEIKGVINPYKINAVFGGETFEAEGIASPRYTITNNSTDVGVKVNATYSADGLDGIVDAADKATDVTKNTKKAKLAYVTLNSTTTAGADADDTFVMSATEQTDLLLTLTEKDGTADSGEIWIGGDTIESPADKWTTKDKLSINIVLDINPYNTGAAGGGAGGGSTVTPGLKQDLVQTDFTGTGITAFAKGSAANEYTMTIDTGVNGGSAIGLNLTSILDTGVTVASKAAAGTNVTVAGMGQNVNITPTNTGTETVTITLSDSNTIVIKLTLN